MINENSVFYHIYPLGFCGAPEYNDFSCPAGGGLRYIETHIPRLTALGINALYIGPLFESSAHGYDTLDYYHVDRRLGNNEDLKHLVRAFHDAGIDVVLDGVFNHSGRHFFAFKDIQERGEASAYRDWYSGVDFSRSGPAGDRFSYEGWHGCYDLVRFNGHNRQVRDHLLGAARFWIEEFDIDGIRLDAADLLLPEFMKELKALCKSLKNNFWLMGEIIAGDYRRWLGGKETADSGLLDSLTNYELYKSLWSSFNDANFYELSWTLNREFGTEGLYAFPLYSFADNHDVNRLASVLKKREHLVPVYGLLFSLPGIPSIYYGSEYGITGERTHNSDRPLRPRWDDAWAQSGADLARRIGDFIHLRKTYRALGGGSFRELYRTNGQYAFVRERGYTPLGDTPLGGNAVPGEYAPVLTAVNCAGGCRRLTIRDGVLGSRAWRDLLTGETFYAGGNSLELPVEGIRILTAV
jgi:glycosidase